jgi:hypothetical protein
MSNSNVIDLRSGGKMHGQIDLARMILIVREGKIEHRYDLAASQREGRTVVLGQGPRTDVRRKTGT